MSWLVRGQALRAVVEAQRLVDEQFVPGNAHDHHSQHRAHADVLFNLRFNSTWPAHGRADGKRVPPPLTARERLVVQTFDWRLPLKPGVRFAGGAGADKRRNERHSESESSSEHEPSSNSSPEEPPLRTPLPRSSLRTRFSAPPPSASRHAHDSKRSSHLSVPSSAASAASSNVSRITDLSSIVPLLPLQTPASERHEARARFYDASHSGNEHESRSGSGSRSRSASDTPGDLSSLQSLISLAPLSDSNSS